MLALTASRRATYGSSSAIARPTRKNNKARFYLSPNLRSEVTKRRKFIFGPKKSYSTYEKSEVNFGPNFGPGQKVRIRGPRSDLGTRSEVEVRSWRVRGGGIPSAISRNTIAQQLRQHLMRGLYNPCRLALLVEAPPIARKGLGANSRKNRLFFFVVGFEAGSERPEQLLT